MYVNEVFDIADGNVILACCYSYPKHIFLQEGAYTDCTGQHKIIQIHEEKSMLNMGFIAN